jgi:hypothetical protein
MTTDAAAAATHNRRSRGGSSWGARDKGPLGQRGEEERGADLVGSNRAGSK